jgi:hypothetical protein
MTTIALVIICCGSFGFICITSMCAYGIRRYLQNRRRGIQEFEEEYRRTQYLKMHRGLGGAEGIGPEMFVLPGHPPSSLGCFSHGCTVQEGKHHPALFSLHIPSIHALFHSRNGNHTEYHRSASAS